MVLESLTNPFKAVKKPWEMFFLGMVYSSVALFLGNWIFNEQASLIMVFLTVAACIPLIYNTMKSEEKKDLVITDERRLLKEHGKVLVYLMLLFAGFVVSFVFWYTVLPSKIVQSTFHVQTVTIQSINVKILGSAIKTRTFMSILVNNLKVLIFCILFSFLYGAGAIFVLTWNASVIAAAIGNFIRTNLSIYATKMGFAKMASYLHIITVGLLKYTLHGAPEIAAYFVAGLAGGIISVAVINESFGTKNFTRIVLDSADLIVIAIMLLVIAGIIEVFITPVIF
jgi:uncharacterized membrane protein SpoIIM required for sporulation